MIFWLNRRVERALAGYLAGRVTGDMRVYRSADLTPRQFPCAVVRAHTNRRFKGEAYACNVMLVSVVVMTEFATIVDDQAKLLEAFEEIQERCVSSVLEMLYLQDGQLATALNAVGIDGVTIHYAACGSDDEQPVTSAMSEDGTVSMVEIPLVIQAGAKEL